MPSSSTSGRTVRGADPAHHRNANARGEEPQGAITQVVPTSILTPQVPLVDTAGWFPPTPRIPLLELPPVPLLPQPVFRLHPAITSVVTFHWDVRLHPEPTGFTPQALSLPAFDSPPDVKSFRLHFNPLPGTPAMDYSCEVKASPRAPPDTPITIGRVFRCIHRAAHAPLEGTALPQSDPYRPHIERAYRRRRSLSGPFDGRVDVIRNVDLHTAGQADDGLFFHGIVVEEVLGPYGPYPIFRVVLKDYPPFA